MVKIIAKVCCLLYVSAITLSIVEKDWTEAMAWFCALCFAIMYISTDQGRKQ